ncbi:hypothetical protein O1611_g4075 [Lasiodiplodia mahajangana]|uniref:Uncharacterized protein n=1 Tax=Lasiodiplodia mahajangana TaxID=1108764 RepID=A0ACC2JPX8_9PEZI|nr:hypothetical protein O1611_g4075 [Lasiodiplodia mahajangana]
MTYMRSPLKKDEDDKILDWLSPTDYGLQQTDLSRRHQSGTGQWLLESTDYQAWIKEPNKTLFCPGIPGSGKTFLTSIVIRNLQEKFRGETGVEITYVYCSSQRQDSQNAEGLLCSLLRRLAYKNSPLPSSIRKLHSRHIQKGTTPSLDEIFRALRSTLALSSRAFIIIDALDECQVPDACCMKLLSAIFHLQSKAGMNIFATSRPVPEIMTRFQGSLSITIRATESDICQYLYGHMNELPVCYMGNSAELQVEIVRVISNAANGRFLLAQVCFESLRDKYTINDVEEVLGNLSASSGAYDNTYRKAVEQIKRQGPDQEEFAKRVLSRITFAGGQLTNLEIQNELVLKTSELELD